MTHTANGSRNRCSAADLRQRIDAAAALLADGVTRTAAVSHLAAQYGIDRRTARRYVAAGARLLVAEVGTADLRSALAESVERLRRLSFQAEQAGNLNAAVGAEKAAAATVVALHRADVTAALHLGGHSLAQLEPMDADRRRYRRPILDPPF